MESSKDLVEISVSAKLDAACLQEETSEEEIKVNNVDAAARGQELAIAAQNYAQSPIQFVIDRLLRFPRDEFWRELFRLYIDNDLNRRYDLRMKAVWMPFITRIAADKTVSEKIPLIFNFLQHRRSNAPPQDSLVTIPPQFVAEKQHEKQQEQPTSGSPRAQQPREQKEEENKYTHDVLNELAVCIQTLFGAERPQEPGKKQRILIEFVRGVSKEPMMIRMTCADPKFKDARQAAQTWKFTSFSEPVPM